MNKNFQLLLVVLVLTLSACSPKSSLSTNYIPVSGSSKAEPTKTVKIDESSEVDCSYEERTVNGQYQYRSSCGEGWFVLYSHAIFRGGPEDPGVVIGYVGVVPVQDKNWITKSDNLNWIALFASKEEARNTACEAVNKLEKSVSKGSEWILPCK